MSKQEVALDNHEITVPQRRRLQAVGAGVIKHALKHSPEVVQRKGIDIGIRRLIRSQAFEVKNLSDQDEIQKALDLEQDIWDQEGYGSLDVYEKYLPQSRIFAAYDDGGRMIGMNRLFAGSPEIPAFLDKEAIPFYEEELRQKLIEDGKHLKIEEFGTVALIKEKRGSRAFLDICRTAFRDAESRGVTAWGIIMEHERVEKMNEGLGFTFKRVGPATKYQGGYCSAHVMDFAEVHAHMHSTKPELYDWFINKPL